MVGLIVLAGCGSGIANAVGVFPADGMDLRLVLNRPFMLGAADKMIDSLHPNALGHQHLATAFQSVL